ncbi:Do family serine endopeptidase [Vulgatibacter sp.]|uniref:Do family serine endopeptidase n=1 Tax=Vulgatibacter sp. TaxID=1971226 RepID=UPI00356569EC
MELHRLALVALLAVACGAKPAEQQKDPARPTLQLIQGPQAVPRVTPPAGELNGALPTLAPLVEAVRPTVVGVTTRATLDPEEAPPELREFWRRFFGNEAPPFEGGPQGPQTGVGSGVIIDPQGIVLTNNHVVEGAEEVLVKTADEKEYTAEVLGTDPETDIAVLRLKEVKGKLPAARLGSSDPLRVGDFVVAIGSPFGLELTVTSGIISAKARVIGAGPYDDFLQTDAAINPGNSGGPLFDLGGNVVGINTAIVATGAGIGFAVPIDLIRAFLPQLVEAGRVVRGYLGVGIQDLTPELAAALELKRRKGAVVASVQPDAPAAGELRIGDVVIGIEGQPVEGAAQLSRRVAQFEPGAKVDLTLLRDGKERKVEVKLGERPREPGVRRPGDEAPQREGPLGLSLQEVPRELQQQLRIQGGALVADVQPGSRAAEAGLQPGDIVVEADRKAVRSPRDLAETAKRAGNRPLLLRVVREEGAAFVVVPPARDAE